MTPEQRKYRDREFDDLCDLVEKIMLNQPKSQDVVKAYIANDLAEQHKRRQWKTTEEHTR